MFPIDRQVYGRRLLGYKYKYLYYCSILSLIPGYLSINVNKKSSPLLDSIFFINPFIGHYLWQVPPTSLISDLWSDVAEIIWSLESLNLHEAYKTSYMNGSLPAKYKKFMHWSQFSGAELEVRLPLRERRYHNYKVGTRSPLHLNFRVVFTYLCYNNSNWSS